MEMQVGRIMRGDGFKIIIRNVKLQQHALLVHRLPSETVHLVIFIQFIVYVRSDLL